MHKVACKDIGVSPSCPFEASAPDMEGAVDEVVSHAKGAHAEALASMGIGESDLRAVAAQNVREEGEEEAPADEAEGAAVDDDEEETE